MGRLQTVVETPAYLKAARGVLSAALRATVVNRWPRSRGRRPASVAVSERSGSLVWDAVRASGRTWCFCSPGEDIPVFLLIVLAKHEKVNLSNRDLTALISAAKELAADYRRDP